MLSAKDFFELDNWSHPGIFTGNGPVWQTFAHLKPYLSEVLQPNLQELNRFGPMLSETMVLYAGELLTAGFHLIPGDATKGSFQVIMNGNVLEGATVLYAGACLMDENIFIGPGSVVEPGALIKGPTIVGANCEIRQGAYLRGHCLVGDRCVVGHTTEVKHSVMMNDAKAGHFAYIGDSILGNNTNLGAGTKLANLKIIDSPVSVTVDGKRYDTGLRKFGAIIGDYTETGCNSVTNPGTLLGRRCLVYPAVSVRGGYYPNRSVVQ